MTQVDQLKPGPWLKIHEELGVAPPEFDDRPLVTYVEAYAESIPDNSALQYFDRGISYRELNELSNCLANAMPHWALTWVTWWDCICPTFHSTQFVVAISKLGAVASSFSRLLASATSIPNRTLRGP